MSRKVYLDLSWYQDSAFRNRFDTKVSCIRRRREDHSRGWSPGWSPPRASASLRDSRWRGFFPPDSSWLWPWLFVSNYLHTWGRSGLRL